MASIKAGEGFATTRWSMVMAAAGQPSGDSAMALEELCAIYWYPLYAFVRRQGYGATEAEDLTQGFFAQFIERDCLSNVGPDKGRFRSFLLVCLRRFLSNVREAEQAAKRGGGHKALSIDFAAGEDRYRLEPAHELTPEKVFERDWALAVLERALRLVAEDFASRGRQKTFEALKEYLVADSQAPAYLETAKALGMSETAVKVAVHRLRQRYRQAVEQEVVQTLQTSDGLDEEISDLLAALAS